MNTLFKSLYETIRYEKEFIREFEMVPSGSIHALLTHATEATLFLYACRTGTLNVCKLL